MKIIKITETEMEFIPAICLDPSVGKESIAAMQDGMSNRINWVKDMIKYGLEIFVALEEPRNEEIHYKWVGNMLHSDLAINGQVPMGLLECIPIEFALEPIIGAKSLFINCMWILPPFWGMGVGKALIKFFLKRAKHIGGASVLAYDGDKWCGTSINYMPCSFFTKFGFEEIERDDSRVLLHLDFGASALPKLIYPKIGSLKEQNKAKIDAFYNYQCPWSQLMIDDLCKNLEEEYNLDFNTIETNSRKVIEKFGISRGLILNGKPIIKRLALWNEMKKEIQKVKN
ncbi:MAG: GNAT family N-acetyltransferase [Promethearchaeota archaeon]